MFFQEVKPRNDRSSGEDTSTCVASLFGSNNSQEIKLLLVLHFYCCILSEFHIQDYSISIFEESYMGFECKLGKFLS